MWHKLSSGRLAHPLAQAPGLLGGGWGLLHAMSVHFSAMKADPPPYTVPAGTDIGHVHLKVSDIERSLEIYCGVLMLELTTRFGAQAAFISAGGYHPHIGLNTWESRGGSPPPSGRTGLYHAAIRYPTRRDLG